MRFLFIITSAIVMYSVSSWASCSEIVAELNAMKEAQSAIQNSLIANHAMFASTLESYSEALSESAGKVHKVVSSNMVSSAESFRSRGLQARKTALKLDVATEDLIQKISKCIK